MAFKDNWRPRIDNVDDADASAVNEIAEAVISNEERIKTIEKNTYSKKEANETFANALKGSVTGSAVRMDGVSPVAHEMAVKVSGVDDVSAVNVQRYGKNIVDTRLENWGALPHKQGPKGVRIPVKDGETFTASWEQASDAVPTYFTLLIYKPDGTYTESVFTGEKVYYKKFTKTAENGNEYYLDCALAKNALPENMATWLSKIAYIQVEIGATATKHEPYIAPTEYTVNPDGTVDGVISLSPTTTLMTDTEDAVIDVEYNRDLNKAFAALEGIVNALIVG